MECSFCPPAKNFWSRIADEAGVDLRVIIIEKEEGAQRLYGVSGYPCLVCASGEKYYGIHYAHTEAKEILASAGKKT